MKFTRSLALGLLAATALSAVVPAQAQVPSINYTSPAQVASNRATIVGLVPASSATDLFTIQGVAGKAIQIKKIRCSGISTAAATALLQVVKRSTLDTGGTSTTMTNVRLNSNNPAGTALVKAYTANPTLGTSIGVLDAAYLSTNTLATSAFDNGGVTFDFSNQWLWINEATTQVAVNANATSLTAGASLDCTVEWDEQ